MSQARVDMFTTFPEQKEASSIHDTAPLPGVIRQISADLLQQIKKHESTPSYNMISIEVGGTYKQINVEAMRRINKGAIEELKNTHPTNLIDALEPKDLDVLFSELASDDKMRTFLLANQPDQRYLLLFPMLVNAPYDDLQSILGPEDEAVILNKSQNLRSINNLYNHHITQTAYYRHFLRTYLKSEFERCIATKNCTPAERTELLEIFRKQENKLKFLELAVDSPKIQALLSSHREAKVSASSSNNNLDKGDAKQNANEDKHSPMPTIMASNGLDGLDARNPIRTDASIDLVAEALAFVTQRVTELSAMDQTKMIGHRTVERWLKIWSPMQRTLDEEHKRHPIDGLDVMTSNDLTMEVKFCEQLLEQQDDEIPPAVKQAKNINDKEKYFPTNPEKCNRDDTQMDGVLTSTWLNVLGRVNLINSMNAARKFCRAVSNAYGLNKYQSNGNPDTTPASSSPAASQKYRDQRNRGEAKWPNSTETSSVSDRADAKSSAPAASIAPQPLVEAQPAAAASAVNESEQRQIAEAKSQLKQLSSEITAARHAQAEVEANLRIERTNNSTQIFSANHKANQQISDAKTEAAKTLSDAHAQIESEQRERNKKLKEQTEEHSKRLDEHEEKTNPLLSHAKTQAAQIIQDQSTTTEAEARNILLNEKKPLDAELSLLKQTKKQLLDALGKLQTETLKQQENFSNIKRAQETASEALKASEAKNTQAIKLKEQTELEIAQTNTRIQAFTSTLSTYQNDLKRLNDTNKQTQSVIDKLKTKQDTLNKTFEEENEKNKKLSQSVATPKKPPHVDKPAAASAATPVIGHANNEDNQLSRNAATSTKSPRKDKSAAASAPIPDNKHHANQKVAAQSEPTTEVYQQLYNLNQYILNNRAPSNHYLVMLRNAITERLKDKRNSNNDTICAHYSNAIKFTLNATHNNSQENRDKLTALITSASKIQSHYPVSGLDKICGILTGIVTSLFIYAIATTFQMPALNSEAIKQFVGECALAAVSGFLTTRAIGFFTPSKQGITSEINTVIRALSPQRPSSPQSTN